MHVTLAVISPTVDMHIVMVKGVEVIQFEYAFFLQILEELGCKWVYFRLQSNMGKVEICLIISYIYMNIYILYRIINEFEYKKGDFFSPWARG